MTDVTALLAPVKARAEKATEGPWVTYHENGVPGQLEAFNCPPATGAFLIEYADRDQQQRDANFMAHSRDDVPRLVAALEAVVKVHEPVDALMNPGRHERVVKVCTGCGTDDGNWQRWPCPTITAVVAALGEDK